MTRLPGNIALSRLKVYDTSASDGQRGGTPHVHLVCSELYFVLSGSGAVELIDGRGFHCVPLHPGTALTFTPGTIHRLINPQGDLEILVLMDHSGLPEHGDCVVSFAEEWLASDECFKEAMHVTDFADAYQRRDRGVEGFLALKNAFEFSSAAGETALKQFFSQAEARTRPLRASWEPLIQPANTPVPDAQNLAYLLAADHALIEVAAMPKPGLCGALYRYIFAPEGILTL